MAPNYLTDLLISNADMHDVNTRAVDHGELNVPELGHGLENLLFI